MTNWHRLFGLALIDFFTGTPYTVELEKDLSIKQQFLDVVIIRKTGNMPVEPLPDGLDNLAEHSLITYKSLQEPLDDWALKELIGHYVNYRKQISGDVLLAEKLFRLYAISTRFPQKLSKQITLEEIQPGVYNVKWGTDHIRLIVLNTIPKTPANALWCLFSSDPELITWGQSHYKQHTKEISTIMQQLFKLYKTEGVNMSYTMDDYRRDFVRENLNLLSTEEVLSCYNPEQRLAGLSGEQRLAGLSGEQRLAGLSGEQRLAGLSGEQRLAGLSEEQRLAGLSEEQRLAGLSEEQIRSYLEKLQHSKN